MKKQRMLHMISRRTMLSFAALLVLSIAPCVSAATPGTAAPNTPSPNDPPLNSTAYVALAGSYSYIAAGNAMRDQGYANITTVWTGTLVKAYLIWGIINPDSTSDTTGKMNGNNLTGTFQATDFSPCWENGNLSIFAADVTAYVVNGTNHLTDFPSGVTSGIDPWSTSTIAPLIEGASLIVIHTGAVTQQIYIYTGAYTSFGATLSSTFNHGAAEDTTATTTYVVADGQLPGNTAGWNGAIIDSDAFNGSDPHVSPGVWSYGSLWDTKTYTVPILLGSTSQNATVASNGYDCITWSAQVIAIPTHAPIRGVPEFGVPSVLVVAISMLGFAFLVKKRSSLFSVVP